jgi:hypothetical protein
VSRGGEHLKWSPVVKPCPQWLTSVLGSAEVSAFVALCPAFRREEEKVVLLSCIFSLATRSALVPEDPREASSQHLSCMWSF